MKGRNNNINERKYDSMFCGLVYSELFAILGSVIWGLSKVNVQMLNRR
jgi:hypothetical protein